MFCPTELHNPEFSNNRSDDAHEIFSVSAETSTPTSTRITDKMKNAGMEAIDQKGICIIGYNDFLFFHSQSPVMVAENK